MSFSHTQMTQMTQFRPPRRRASFAHGRGWCGTSVAPASFAASQLRESFGLGVGEDKSERMTSPSSLLGYLYSPI